nr:hypothetical protein [Tanacetum cinerariifolium]
MVLISGTGGEERGDGEDAKDMYPMIRWQINEKGEREEVKEGTEWGLLNIPDGEDAKDMYPMIRWQINEKGEREEVKGGTEWGLLNIPGMVK